VQALEQVEMLCRATPSGDARFATARGVLARKLARLQLVSDYLDRVHGGSPVSSKGQVIKAARLELDLMASVERSLAELGLTPMAAAKLGVDLARTGSLVDEIAVAKAARQRADRRTSRLKPSGRG
jgi:hypothetical protein